MALEHTEHWAEILAMRDEHSLRAIGERFGATPGQVSAALCRAGARWGPPAPTLVLGEDDDLPPEPGEESSAHGQRARARPGSKDSLIIDHLDKLGRRPDAEVAALAGVSVRTVASFRARNEIAGYAGPRRKPTRTRHRKSKIDPYADLVGSLSDREVAKRAGVTLNAVRNYRQKRGISAPGAASSNGAPPSSGRLQAWKLVANQGGEEVIGIILAHGLVEAAKQAAAKGFTEASISLSFEGDVLD